MKTKLFFFLLLVFSTFFSESNAASPKGGDLYNVIINKLGDTTYTSSLILHTNIGQVNMSGGNFYNNFLMDGLFLYIQIDNPQIEIGEVRDQSNNSLIPSKSKGIYMFAQVGHWATSSVKDFLVTFKYTCQNDDKDLLAKVKIYLVGSADTTLRFTSLGTPQYIIGIDPLIDSTSTTLKYNPGRCKNNSDFVVKPLDIKTSCNNAKSYNLKVESLDKGDLHSFKARLYLPRHLVYLKKSAAITTYNKDDQIAVINSTKQTFLQEPIISDTILTWDFSKRLEPDGISTDSTELKKYFIISFILISDSTFQGGISHGNVQALDFYGDTINREMPAFSFKKVADSTYYYSLPQVGSSQTVRKICESDSVQLSTKQYPLPDLTYSWTWNGVHLPSNSSQIIAKQSGTYVCGISNGCYTIDTYIASVVPYERPFSTIRSYTLCPGSKVSLGSYPSYSGVNYTWSTKKGLSDSTAANPTASPDVTTKYYVTVVDHAYNCTHLDSAIVKVAFPPANAGSDKTICLGDSIYVGTLPLDGIIYNWSTTSINEHPKYISSPLVYPKITSKYMLSTFYGTETYNNNNCVSHDTVTVTVLQPPVANAGSDKTICMGSLVNIGSSPVSGLFYTWKTDSSSVFSNISNPLISPKATTEYIVRAFYDTVLYNTYGCINNIYDTVIVTILPSPIAHAGTDVSVCNGSNVMIGSSPITGLRYSWTPADELSASNIANPISYTASDKNYILTVKDGNNCVGSDTIHVTVNYCATNTNNATAVTNTSNATDSTATITSISSKEDKGFYQLYPNPTSGVFTIDMIQDQSISYELVNPAGSVIMNKSNVYDRTMDIRSLPAGVYYITITSGNNSYRTKIVKN